MRSPSGPHLFTSESVSMGHPDKVADQIADAVLDTALEHDRDARVACEVLLTGELIVIAGEITSTVEPDFGAIVADTAAVIGYDADSGFDAEGAELRVAVQRQSLDIARGVDRGGELGAGDQGMMFGHATNQTPELMPLPIMLSHSLVARQAEARQAGLISSLRPDAKSQVSIVYEGPKPLYADSVILSTQHGPEWNERQDELREAVIAEVIQPGLGEWLRDDTAIHVNPTGRFEQGGPAGDTGLTGRKIIVDTYGGWARHGGGAFSGKDPTKVDRSASYMARHIAKTIVAAGLADECEVRLGYAIGVAEPTAVDIVTNGTGRVADDTLATAAREVFPLTPSGIISYLDLNRPIYRPTSYHGHFGRTPGEAGAGTFTWEATSRMDGLIAASGA